MANTTTVGVDVNVKTNVAGSIGELKALKKQLKETAAGSAEFKNLTNQIDDLEDKIKGARQGAGDWVDQLASAGGPLGALGNALNKAKVSTVSFGTALKATGIGLVVTLIAGLVAAFAESEKATKKLQPLLIGFQKIFAGIFAAIEPVFNAFVDFAVEALPMVTKGIGMAYSAVTAFIQGLGLLGSAVSKLIKGDFSGAWDSAKEAVTGFGERYDEANKRFIDGTKEVTKIEQEELDRRKEAAEKAAEERRKREEAEIENEKKRQERLRELRAITDEANFERIKKRNEIEKNIDNNFAKEKEQLAINQLTSFQSKIDELRLFNLQNLQNDATKEIEIRKFAIQEQQRINEENYNKGIADRNAYLARKKELDNAEMQLDEQVYENKVALAQGVSGIISSLSELAGRDTAAGKALAIANATIDTFVSASTIFRQAAKNPITIANPAYPYIAAAPAVISGIARVKQIASIKVPGGGASATQPISQGATGAPIAPSAPLVNTRTQLDAATIQQMGSATNRAYVVESDVTNSQERIRRINRAARLG